MVLQAAQALPSEMGPALHAHLREHFGGNTTLHPHRAPTVASPYLRPRTEPRIHFYDLPPLATISEAIVAADVGATHAEMAMALTYQQALGQYGVRVATGRGWCHDPAVLHWLDGARRWHGSSQTESPLWAPYAPTKSADGPHLDVVPPQLVLAAGKVPQPLLASPRDLQEWLHEQVAVPTMVQYEHRWGPNYRRGLGVLLHSFTSDQ